MLTFSMLLIKPNMAISCQKINHSINTSHSPYMIEALYFYSKKFLDEKKVAFYYTEKTDIENYTEIKETKDLSIIFDKLSKPLEQLVWD